MRGFAVPNLWVKMKPMTAMKINWEMVIRLPDPGSYLDDKYYAKSFMIRDDCDYCSYLTISSKKTTLLQQPRNTPQIPKNGFTTDIVLVFT